MPTSFKLSYPVDEFDLGRCVNSGQVFRWERLTDDSWLGVEGCNWYRVRVSDASGASARYDVESNSYISGFRDLFRLDWQAGEVERAILDRGPELAPYVDAMRGLRVMRQSDPHETLFTFLCTPNNHISRIRQMVRKLAAYGEPMAEVAGIPLHLFPSAEVIAEIPESELRSKGFGYRARSIPRAAQQLLEKPAGWLESLKVLSYEEAFRELSAIHGIGPKLADCIALFGLHHMGAVPIDTHMWQVATRLYFPEWQGEPLTGRRYREFGDFFRDRFGDLAGWAQQYLFYENVLNWRERRKTPV